MSNNKTLLIKAPSTIDADLLAVDEMRVTLRTPANYGGTSGDNAIGLSEKGTFKVLSGNSTLLITNNDKDFSPVNGTNETDISIVSLKDYTKLLRLGGNGNYSIIGFKTFYADNNIDILEDCPSLTSLNINSSNVTGDISKLSTLTGLTRLKLFDGNISGSFSSIVNLMPNLAGDIYLTKGVTYTDADLATIKSRGGNIVTGTKV